MKIDSTKIEVYYTDIYWHQNGYMHREDGGPAIEAADGSMIWMHRGVRHREDGPAIIYPDGTEVWRIMVYYQNQNINRLQ